MKLKLQAHRRRLPAFSAFLKLIQNLDQFRLSLAGRPGKKKREAARRRRNLFLNFGILIIIDSLLVILTLYHLTYRNKIYPGISVKGMPIGNRTLKEARSMIALLPGQKNKALAKIPKEIFLHHKEQQWPIDLEKINFSYQAEKTAQKAFLIGRSGDFFKDVPDKIQSWQEGIDLEIDYSLNSEALETEIATIAAQIYSPVIEPNIESSQSEIKIDPGKAGQELDQEKLKKILNSRFLSFNFDPIPLPILELASPFSASEIDRTRQRAEKFLGQKLILTNGQTNWEWQEKELIQLLSFTNGFNQEKIEEWLKELAKSINQSPENATLQFTQGKIVEFRPAKEGQILNREQTIKAVIEGLNQLELLANQNQSPTEIKIELPLIKIPPPVQTTNVDHLGLKQQIGRGISNFSGSISSRIHNIQLASSRLNGLIIPPEQIFSFNETLGDISKATGYKEAYIIKEGRTVLGDGGGVCQVSTTLFRAILDAGLPILERHPHAYRVSYYEQGSPPGIDATVFDPTADLKFKNDTPAYILIQTKIDLEKKSLAFELYGTHDGRTVTLSKPRLWDQTPPPPDLYQDDPTLPVGTIKQIDWKSWGAKAAFDYHVERNGEVIQNQTFYSAYRPWQAVFLRGTKPPGS